LKSKVLIVDDEKLLRWSARRKCEEWGYQVSEAADVAEGLARVHDEVPDAVLLDVRLPDGSGVDLLRQIRSEGSPSQVIMITADPKVDDVKAALKLGAYDYLTKPVDFDELRLTLSNALETNRLREEVDTLRDQVRQRLGYHDVVGPSAKMQAVMEFARKIAASEATAILIQGESGTGKDLIAKAIHYHSSRHDRPFVALNCSAIPETLLEAELFGHEKGAFTDAKAMKKGLVEVANGGTVFLDEVGEMPLLLEAKVLRTLEDQTFRRVGGLRDITVDVRIVAASNRNLEAAVRAGQFRQDLFYRLMVIPIFIPPLRSRREDIPALTEFFIAHYNKKFRKKIEGLTPEAEKLMMSYSWPGNVRELKNAIQRAMILEDGSRIRPIYLPFYSEAGAPMLTMASAFPDAGAENQGEHWQELPTGRLVPSFHIPEAGTSMEDIERRLVEQALEQCHGNQSQASRLLNISRDALRYKMKKFGLDGGEASA
jgi:DNA-binding NtrC family response regulator